MAKNKKNYRKTELTGKNFTFDFNTFFFDFWSREKTKIQKKNTKHCIEYFFDGFNFKVVGAPKKIILYNFQLR